MVNCVSNEYLDVWTVEKNLIYYAYTWELHPIGTQRTEKRATKNGRAVIKRQGLGISPGYSERNPQLLS